MDIRRRAQMGGIKKTSSGGGDIEIDTTYAIYYTSSDGNIVTPYKTDVFGANIVSNNYINGQGIISFDGPVTTIGNEAFRNCSSLTSVTIPDSVTTIGFNAFRSCSSLTSVTIGDSVTKIGNWAFTYCSSLISVAIPDSVTTIGDNAFRYCESLTSVYCKATTPPALSNAYVFDDNGSGRKIYVPTESVDAYKSAYRWSEYADAIVGYDFEDDGEVDIDTTYAIYYTSSDGNIVTPYKTDVFGANIVSNNYINGHGIISFGGSITEIGDYAFYECSGLTRVTIPDSVTTIGHHTFAYCTSLTSITIPDSVTSIGDYAFYKCFGLTSVYCKATTPPAGGSSMFNSNFYGSKIYVPVEAVEAYKSASYWSSYADDIVGYDFGQESVNLITFIVNGVVYQAEEGMTWGEWVDSEYNVINALIYGSYISITIGGSPYLIYDSNYNTVSTTQEIIINHNYMITGGGSGN